MSRRAPTAQPAQAPRARTLVALAAVLAVAIGLAGVGWMLRSLHWPITVVRIDGDLRHASSESVERIVTPHVAAGGFFSLDLDTLRADLEALPWLRQASLRRIWPDTLDVVVHEHQPAARWNEAALISVRGDVFRPRHLPDLELPALAGPEGHGTAMLARLREMDRGLEPLRLSVRGLHQDARRSWRLELNNGVVLRLGRSEIDMRLGRFRSVWPMVLAQEAERIEAVDLRYPNGFAVAWREDAEATPREGGA